MSSFPLARASEYWKDGGWSIDFRRSLTISERASWEELENSLPTSLVEMSKMRWSGRWTGPRFFQPNPYIPFFPTGEFA